MNPVLAALWNFTGTSLTVTNSLEDSTENFWNWLSVKNFLEREQMVFHE